MGKNRNRARRLDGQCEEADKQSGSPSTAPQETPVTYDGPSDNRPSRAPSTAGGSQTVRSSSRARSGSRGPATRQDAPSQGPARSSRKGSERELVKNVDLGGGAYNLLADPEMSTDLAIRPGFSTAGKVGQVKINSFPVIQYPNTTVTQWDVAIGSGDEKRGLIMAAAESKAFKKAVGPGFIFDGHKIGWTLRKDLQPEIRILVDLDEEKGIPPRVDKKTGEPRENKVRVKLTKGKSINLEFLRRYVELPKQKFDVHVLECINFMDHLLRETPKKTHINLRRSYFARTPLKDEVLALGNGIEAIRGVYQSLRAVEGGKLVINVDVSNSCFWHQTSFAHLAFLISGESSKDRFKAITQPVGNKEPPIFQTLKRLAKNKFQVKHGNQSNEASAKVWTMMRLSRYNAKTYVFNVKNRETGQETPTTLFNYYLTKYKVHIEMHQLPLVESNKPGVLFPMELCFMLPGQRYPYKLNEDQTSKMITFAASRPLVRKTAIERGLDMLNWESDPFLKNYGMKISRDMVTTNARILPPPVVRYKNSTAAPGYSGRWNLKGNAFLKPNPQSLVAWGVVVLNPSSHGRPLSKPQVVTFINGFINQYKILGGAVDTKDPDIIMGVPDAAKAIETAWFAVGNRHKRRPQIFIVILPEKTAEVYQRVKKNMDCRWGVMSQCVQARQVMKGHVEPYAANVLMKFNCKLGGTTSTVAPINKSKKPLNDDPPVMIIGADVTHAAPGSVQASIAALTVSMDETQSRYAAGCQTNGYRVEMIQTKVLEEILKPLIQNWVTDVGGGRLPKHVYYFRDGVSEGQYVPLKQQELADIQRIFEGVAEKASSVPKFTVVVCEKRHHIRFFPGGSPFAVDKNSNPVPGVLVERDVTHKQDYDMYLCSHNALQGTARPTHYYVIHDDKKVPVDEFQKMLYEQCYQYQRSTTPVSLHPAVYYAHLAAARAVAHINISEMEKWTLARNARQQGGQQSSNEVDSLAEAPPLIPTVNQQMIRFGMWYI